MMRYLTFIFVFIVVSVASLQAQRAGGVVIADTLAEAHESAMLQIISTNKGLLLPVVSKNERDAIKPLVPGLTVFVTGDSASYQYWNGHRWLALEMVNATTTSIIAPLGGVVMYHGRFNNFEPDGKGKLGTEMEGWQLCNGKNGSPDLSGRFIVGGGKPGDVEGIDPRYAEVGRMNDYKSNNNIKITKENMTSHSHDVSKSVTITHSHSHPIYSHNEYPEGNGEKKEYENKHTHQYKTWPSGSKRAVSFPEGGSGERPICQPQI